MSASSGREGGGGAQMVGEVANPAVRAPAARVGHAVRRSVGEGPGSPLREAHAHVGRVLARVQPAQPVAQPRLASSRKSTVAFDRACCRNGARVLSFGCGVDLQ